MSVKLIGMTRPEETLHNLGLYCPEEIIGYAARVSNPKNQGNAETMPKLYKYLIKHGHWSPLEMVNIVLEIETSRAIGRQLLRHKSMNFQEKSQRYAQSLEWESVECRLQHPTNRQKSTPSMNKKLNVWWLNTQMEVMQLALQKYREAIDKGIAKEMARFLLPESMLTTIVVNGTLRSWYHWIQLREKWDTQKEHQKIVAEVKRILISHFGNIFDIGVKE
jgi:thymidylate synthase (FAD)